MAKKDLLEALVKFRDEVIVDHNMAANPGPYLEQSDYDSASGKEFAYDEVLYMLNEIIKEHS